MSDVHLDDELLAGIALGEGATPRQTDHLDDCPTCSANLAELRQLRAQAGEADPREVLTPHPGLLSRIHAELLEEPVPQTQTQRVTTPPSAGRGPARWRSLVAVAAALGLIVGAGGAVALERLRTPPTQLLGSTNLQALPGWTGGGNAELVREGSIDQLRVRVSAPNPSTAFRELWLINTDGQRMISLGVLDASGQGSYPLPPILTGNLHGYVVVDVSAEPFDGNSAHSRNSIVRGQLP